MVWKRKRRKEELGTKFWKSIALMGTLGWNLVIPIVAGALIGQYLDQRFGQGHSWTLSLLALGVMIAFYNLYNLVQMGKEK